MIHKIFKKENKHYNFYIGLPMLLWLELFVCYLLLPGNSLVQGLLFFFGIIGSVTSIVLGILNWHIRKTFIKQFNDLTEEWKNNISRHAIAKSWGIYLSEYVLIQYKMFTRRVIFIDDILNIQRKQGIRALNAGVYRMADEVDEMILTLKNGKCIAIETSDELIEAVEGLLEGKNVKTNSIEGKNSTAQKPVEGITALALLGSIVCFMGGYGRLQFLTDYKSYFWLGAVILTAICFLITFIWRFLQQKGGKLHTLMNTIWCGIVILLIMLVYVEYNRLHEYSHTTRMDYQLCQAKKMQ